MRNPRTIYEILELLETYHEERLSTYRRLAKDPTDAMAQALLEHLVELEDHSLKAVRIEMREIDPEHATYLTTGPVLNDEASHAGDCHCGSNPTYQEALTCALESNQLLDQLLDRLEGGSAAPSVLHLAKRLRELEQTKDRQIANFTRPE